MANPRKPEGESGLVRAKVLRGYKKSAERRGLEWGLSNDECYKLFKSDCHYCGGPPSQSQSKKDRGVQRTFVYSGIDRVLNDVGYLSGNVVACCKTCNWAKSDLSLEEFRMWAARLYNKFSNVVPVPQMVP